MTTATSPSPSPLPSSQHLSRASSPSSSVAHAPVPAGRSSVASNRSGNSGLARTSNAASPSTSPAPARGTLLQQQQHSRSSSRGGSRAGSAKSTASQCPPSLTPFQFVFFWLLEGTDGVHPPPTSLTEFVASYLCYSYADVRHITLTHDDAAGRVSNGSNGSEILRRASQLEKEAAAIKKKASSKPTGKPKLSREGSPLVTKGSSAGAGAGAGAGGGGPTSARSNRSGRSGHSTRSNAKSGGGGGDSTMVSEREGDGRVASARSTASKQSTAATAAVGSGGSKSGGGDGAGGGAGKPPRRLVTTPPPSFSFRTLCVCLCEITSYCSLSKNGESMAAVLFTLTIVHLY